MIRYQPSGFDARENERLVKLKAIRKFPTQDRRMGQSGTSSASASIPRIIGTMLPVVGLRLPEGRVGSTLLMRLIASSPVVALDRRYPYGEYRYLSYAAKAADFMSAPWRPDIDPGVTALFFGESDVFGPLPFDPQSLDHRQLGASLLRHLWEAFSSSILAKDGSLRLYAEKLAVAAEPLLEAGIPLRVVDCIRDPRDVLASIRAFTANNGVDGFGRRHHESESDYLPRFVARFGENLDQMTHTPEQVDRVVVRYEDLAADLPTVAARLSDWLGLEFDPSLAERSSAEHPEHLTSDSVADSVGRWNRDLTSEEAEYVWAALGSRLVAHGYSK